ncbi:minor capsid protein [Haloimpatiens massiliensis]|uniref:minor capsid protein n=1 Tax=Haloimpatiens massiliensis TaxID=1658110 RepID=UPI000C81F12F|nr:minor capsid protein [Haloimpatiens massiliensis]
MLKEKILEIKKEAIEKANAEAEEAKQRHKRLKGVFLLLLMDYFENYSKDGRFSVNRFQRKAILSEVEQKVIKETKALAQEELQIDENVLDDIVKNAYEKHVDVIGGDKNILLNPVFTHEIIFKDYRGDSFENRILNNKRKLAGKLYSAFDKVLLNNSTLGEASEIIKEVFDKSDYESYRLLMNEQGRVFDAVQTKIFIDEATIEKVMWASALCPNTCPYCEMMDGSVFEVNDPNKPEIPVHVLCQCCWIPV